MGDEILKNEIIATRRRKHLHVCKTFQSFPFCQPISTARSRLIVFSFFCKSIRALFRHVRLLEGGDNFFVQRAVNVDEGGTDQLFE